MTTLSTINSTDNGTVSLTKVTNNLNALNSGKIETSVIDTDGTLTANSDAKLPSQKAVKTYVDSAATTVYLADGQGMNYQLSTSIATDDLTVALKTLDGGDPAASDTAKFSIANAILEVDSALSVTITDALGDIFGWDARKIQGNDAQLFVYIINNNGTDQIGVSPSPNLRTVATNYYDDAGQTGSAGQTNIVMSGTRNATNSCRVIGRVNVLQNDDNTWSAPTAALTVNHPIFETDELNWTPVLTDDPSDMSTFTSAKYILQRNVVFFIFRVVSANMSGSAGTSAFRLPFTSTNTLNSFNANIYNGTSYNWCVCWNSTTTKALFYKSGSTNWAASETGVQVYISGYYAI